MAASHNDVTTAMCADLGEVMRDWLRVDVGSELDAGDAHGPLSRLVDAIRAGDAVTAAEEAAGYPFLCRPGRFSAPRW